MMTLYPKKRTDFVAFFSFFVSCKIQTNPRFFDVVTDFYNTRDTANLEQMYPVLNTTRINQCATCPASTNFNEGLGMDCWFKVKLPVGDEIAGYIYESLTGDILNTMRDLEIANSYEDALHEIAHTQNAIVGGISNGWVLDSELLHRKVEMNTTKNSYSISPASVIASVFRDGSVLPHVEFLSQIFDIRRLQGVSPQSPINTLALLFDIAKNIKKPVQTRIVPILQHENQIL